ncbi:MAG: hypothetical protein WDZ82_01285 [Candidatus Paceibacterota bacterium]
MHFKFWRSYWTLKMIGKRCFCKKCKEACRRVERFHDPDTGKWVYVTQPPHEQYCAKCLAAACIKCAWCGKSIFPAEPITLYTPTKSFEIPEYAVVYNQDPVQLVGCLRWDCGDSGIDRAGFWIPPGVVDRVLSPTEELLHRMQSGESDPIVIANDLSDPNEAKRLV